MFEGVNWFTQIIIPSVLGGIISFLRYTFQDKQWRWTEGLFKHFLSGSIAGIVAVNMFNPRGTFDQVIVISVFAGTHGMAWILANSFMSSKSASSIINDLYDKDVKTIKNIMKFPVDKIEDETKVLKMLDFFVDESEELP